jgi:hypothetical protein
MRLGAQLSSKLKLAERLGRYQNRCITFHSALYLESEEIYYYPHLFARHEKIL